MRKYTEDKIIKIGLLYTILYMYDRIENKKIYINDFDYKIYVKRKFKYINIIDFKNDADIKIYIKSDIKGDININYYNDNINNKIILIPYYDIDKPIIIYGNIETTKNNKKKIELINEKKINDNWDKKKIKIIIKKYNKYFEKISKITNNEIQYNYLFHYLNIINNNLNYNLNNEIRDFIIELINKINNFDKISDIKDFIMISKINNKEKLINIIEPIIEIIISNNNINNLNFNDFILKFLINIINIKKDNEKDNEIDSLKHTLQSEIDKILENNKIVNLMKLEYDKQFKIIDKVYNKQIVV
jgi:hypothetical protein